MRKKYTLEEVKELFIKKGYNPLFDEYKNGRIKMTAETKEGYKIYTTLDGLLSKFKASIIGNGNIYTIENIKLWLKLNNKPYKLLIETYIESGEKLQLIDDKGYKLSTSWENLKASKIPNIFDKSNPYTIENIKLFIKLNCLSEYELINTEFLGVNKNLLLITKEGYKINTTWTGISKLQLNSMFSVCNPYTIENIKLYIKLNNIKYELLSTEYNGNDQTLLFECKSHGEFESTWDNIKQKHGCKKCFIERMSGNTSPKWRGGITPLIRYVRRKVNCWRKDSLKFNNYTCNITGQVGGDLVIHHLYSFKHILEEAMNELNMPIYENIISYSYEELNDIVSLIKDKHYEYGLGVCLAKDVHDEFHKIYGKYSGKNTPEQFDEFKQRYLNHEFDQTQLKEVI